MVGGCVFVVEVCKKRVFANIFRCRPEMWKDSSNLSLMSSHIPGNFGT